MKRRPISILASIALLAGLLGLTTGTVAGRTANSCYVKNGATEFGPGPGSVLQAAIDAAASGDTLTIRGRCVGHFFVRVPRMLSLVGVKGGGYKTATLDGGDGDSGSTLSVDGSWIGGYWAAGVTVTNLLITGAADSGIYSFYGVVTLDGSTRVSGNGGHGIADWTGILTLNDTSSVSGNTVVGSGGGIFSFRGDVSLNDSSSVSGNSASYSGGGIELAYTELTLRGSASITGNTAGVVGGGIGSSAGWGIVRACDTWTGAVNPNSPDDAPAPTIVTC